ncbi:hypothetical protein COLO4_13656 [Corchorus olitorius]|uniref:Uncharacterized protein n=1 Tax=Corchorus olitorius TaxID=93759 RepID=A0A1R3JVI8_9ROSI|nr:hypothetical protein COLO4_13656 [Corchorus olitorius]
MSLRYISRTCLKVVQWGKDQNPKGIIKPSQGRPKAESDNSAQIRCISGGSESAKVAATTGKGISRESEKIENAMHLVLWGPK